jgi:hypothetical protein
VSTVFDFKLRSEEMSMERTEQQSLQISQERLLAFVRAMIGGSRGREDDEHPLPPGPWDPVIRVALERINVFGPHPDPWKIFGPGPQPWRTLESMFGPLPDPWKVILASIAAKYPAVWDVIGGGPSVGTEVALNPQPLPPRFAFLVSLAQTVISRTELLQEIADATRREGEQQGIIIVGGYIARFIDDICGNDFRFKWPFPGPRPNWLAKEVSGIDLVVMAVQFDQAASETFNRELRQNLADASAKLAEAGLSKIQ